MRRETGNRIVDLSFEFALDIIAFCERLNEEKKFAIANQLIRCGTSVGANIAEAQSSESKADFIHKLKIAEKEVHETKYWLELCRYADGYPFEERMMEAGREIERLLGSIIHSARKNLMNEHGRKTGFG